MSAMMTKRATSEDFHAVLEQIGELHDRKQKDYGSNNDPYHNVRSTEAWGIPAHVGALMRLNDKVNRLQSYIQTGELHNEGAEDSMLDIAVYAIIALVLHREANEEG